MRILVALKRYVARHGEVDRYSALSHNSHENNVERACESVRGIEIVKSSPRFLNGAGENNNAESRQRFSRSKAQEGIWARAKDCRGPRSRGC